MFQKSIFVLFLLAFSLPGLATDEVKWTRSIKLHASGSDGDTRSEKYSVGLELLRTVMTDGKRNFEVGADINYLYNEVSKAIKDHALGTNVQLEKWVNPKLSWFIAQKFNSDPVRFQLLGRSKTLGGVGYILFENLKGSVKATGALALINSVYKFPKTIQHEKMTYVSLPLGLETAYKLNDKLSFKNKSRIWPSTHKNRFEADNDFALTYKLSDRWNLEGKHWIAYSSTKFDVPTGEPYSVEQTWAANLAYKF